jgi:hypothetical protein
VKNAAKAVKVTGEQTESMFLRAALLDSGGVQLLGLIEAVAFGVNLDDLCPMDETVDESDHAGGVREDLAPFGQCLVGTEEQRSVGVVASCDDLEQEVGVVADFVDHVITDSRLSRTSNGFPGANRRRCRRRTIEGHSARGSRQPLLALFGGTFRATSREAAFACRTRQRALGRGFERGVETS